MMAKCPACAIENEVRPKCKACGWKLPQPKPKPVAKKTPAKKKAAPKKGK